MKHLLLVTTIVLFFSCNTRTKEYIVKSPSGDISVSVNTGRPESQETLESPASLLTYTVSFHGKVVIEPSGLDIFTNGEGTWHIGDADYSLVEEHYSLHLGKSKEVESSSNQMILHLYRDNGDKMQVHFRAFDDGVAFRYVWLTGNEAAGLQLKEETSYFNMAGNARAHVLCFPNYTSAHETNYTIEALNKLPNDTLIDLPALFELPDNVLVAITEANLKDYPGMYLSKNEKGELYSKLSPLPGEPKLKARLKTPHSSPWRILMIANSPATLLESNIILNLSDPCVIDDTSWIQPNKSTWHWWCGTGVPENAGFKRGMNFETMKYYIDFAADNGITCHSLTDVDGDSWYTSPKDTYPSPGAGTDVTRPNPALQLDKLLAYAHSRNVRIRLWVHWKALEPQLEEAFSLYEQWGIEGLMVDYMDRDDQEMVNFYHRVIESAARHKLTIQFHGAYKPTGLRRTYPNLVTTEGVLNLEFSKWSDRCTPQHNVNVAFTRMLAGPLDYHQGGFRSVTKAGFEPRFKNPVVMGTRCHILGMYVVYESYLQLLCDYPEAYINQPGFDFIRKVPTTWDEIKVLNAEIGEYIVIARRSGADWYIGALNNDTARDIEVAMDFLPDGEYLLEKYTDAADAETNPNHLDFEKTTVTNQTPIRIRLAGGGGTAIHLSPFNTL